MKLGDRIQEHLPITSYRAMALSIYPGKHFNESLLTVQRYIYVQTTTINRYRLMNNCYVLTKNSHK